MTRKKSAKHKGESGLLALIMSHARAGGVLELATPTAEILSAALAANALQAIGHETPATACALTAASQLTPTHL
jgi:hypothetical protein